MSDEPDTQEALRTAYRETSGDASRLVAAVPRLMREATRRQSEAAHPSASLVQLAGRALPRLAAVTAVAVIAAGWVVWRERKSAAATAAPTTLESVILGGGGDGTGDVVFDALLGIERSDG